MNYYLRFINFLIILLLLSCQNDKESRFEKSRELSFAIDNSLLGTTIKDVNKSILYSVPKLWLNTDTSNYKEIENCLTYNEKNLNLKLNPLNIFLDSNSKSYLVVSELKSDFYNLNLKMLDNEITELMKIKFDSASFKKALFIKDGINMLQFLIMLQDKVNFKLIFSAKNNIFLQFDYFISRDTYINEIKAVESSIGSIVYF